MEGYNTPLPFFMTESYQRMLSENVQAESTSEKESEERDYFRQMYPQSVKRYLRVIVEVINRIDVRESFIYDEYPDNIRLERLLETVLRLIPVENYVNRESQRNIVRVLLLEEIMWRRKQLVR